MGFWKEYSCLPGIWNKGCNPRSHAELEEGDSLERCNFKSFSALWVLALNHIVNTDQIGASLRKASTIFVAGVRREGGFLGAASPAYIALGNLAAGMAIQAGLLHFIFFGIEVSFIHKWKYTVFLTFSQV